MKRFQYSRWFGDVIIANGGDILYATFSRVDVWFHLSSYVNSENSRV
jgi:hypothetical protein